MFKLRCPNATLVLWTIKSVDDLVADLRNILASETDTKAVGSSVSVNYASSEASHLKRSLRTTAVVDRTFAGHLETGRRDFRLSSIIRVADALDVPIAELFLGVSGAEQIPKHSRKLGAALERRQILETAATLETAARTLKELAGAELPKRRANQKGS